MKMFFELKILPMVNDRIADERALEQAELPSDSPTPELDQSVEKKRRLRIQNAVLTECMQEEDPDVMATVDKTLADQLKSHKDAAEEAAKQKRIDEALDPDIEGRRPEELQE
jgi:hypothetical protein